MNQEKLIDAAEEYAERYDGDERPDVKTDVLNAFYAGAYYEKNQSVVTENKRKIMLHDTKESGYTVQELADKLQEAIKAGMGERIVYIGPTNIEKLKAGPIAVPVVGIEGNTDEDSAEIDILWIYPGEDEWV